MNGLQTVLRGALELVPHRGLGARLGEQARQLCPQPSAAASAGKAVPPAALWIMLAGENSRGRSVNLDENKITFLFSLTFQ